MPGEAKAGPLGKELRAAGICMHRFHRAHLLFHYIKGMKALPKICRANMLKPLRGVCIDGIFGGGMGAIFADYAAASGSSVRIASAAFHLEPSPPLEKADADSVKAQKFKYTLRKTKNPLVLNCQRYYNNGWTLFP